MMMKPGKILVATTNPGKFKEIKNLFRAESKYFDLVSLSDLPISAPCVEQCTTFEENASQKSIFYSRMAKNLLTVAEDSGLEVEALGKEPGIHSARYAGPDSSDRENIKKLLGKMRGLPNRKACFIALVSLSRNGKQIQSFTGRVEGIILDSPKGENGFGYDPVFYFPPRGKTFAELSVEEKNRFSHRAQAFQKLKEFLLDPDNFSSWY